MNEARMRRFTGGEVDSPSRNLARYIDKIADKYIENLDTMVIYRLDRFGRGGIIARLTTWAIRVYVLWKLTKTTPVSTKTFA